LSIQGGGIVTANDVLLAGGFVGSGSVSISGGGTLVASNVHANDGDAFFDFNGGTLRLTAAAPNLFLSTQPGFRSPLAPMIDVGGATIDTQGFDATSVNPFLHNPALGASPDGGLTKTGTGKLTLAGNNNYTGPTIVSAGKLALTDSLITSSSVTVANGATLELAIGANAVLATSSVTTTGTGKIDLTDNDMIVRSGDFTSVKNLVKSGFGTGTWNGSGITSTTAGASGGITSLGIIQAGDASYSSFDSQTVSSTDVLVKYTYAGDANLDGKVTFDDFQDFLAGFGGAPGSGRWFNGDFNYTGQVTFDDFQIFLTGFGAYNSGGVTLSPADAAHVASLGTTAPAPEPAGGMLLACGAIAMRRSRRRHSRS
jgi:autotransporter-associated beta strand protein